MAENTIFSNTKYFIIDMDGTFYLDGNIIEDTNPVSDEELAERRAAWVPREPKITTGYLARYAKLVSSGAQGAVLS